MRRKSKTVFILGAGFSRDAGAPLQSEIVKQIFELDSREIGDPWLRKTFKEYRDCFSGYLSGACCISEQRFEDVSLEDVFTPIDRCIMDNTSFRSIAPHELIQTRQKISALIIILFRHKLERVHKDYIDAFASYLVRWKEENTKEDPFAVISTNWDILLDNSIKDAIGSQDTVDYCCHYVPYKEDETLLPGLMAIAKGGYNIKLLKIHGSMNWLRCQRCLRLYITFFNKIALEEYLSKPTCRICDRNYGRLGQDGGGFLVSELLMPTFLKDLSDVNMKLIWQNSAIELSEARKVVFLGYSFPSSDFELRQLLSRSVRHDAEIEVVLHESDKPRDDSSDRYLSEFRYKSFFGQRKVVVSYDGVKRYVNSLPK